MSISGNKKLIVCCLLLLPLDGEVMKILEIEMKTKFETEMHNKKPVQIHKTFSRILQNIAVTKCTYSTFTDIKEGCTFGSISGTTCVSTEQS